MPVWEEYKTIIIVISGFLVLYFGVWVFALRGYTEEWQASYNREEALEKEKKAICDPNLGRKTSAIKREIEKANEGLSKVFNDIQEKLAYKFSKDVQIPPEYEKRPPIYVRQREKMLADYISKETFQRQIEISTQVSTAGFSLPEEMNEDLATDLKWLRQMETVFRLTELLFSVFETKHAETGKEIKNILRIDSVMCNEPQITGSATEKFMREYPVEIKMHVTLQMLMQLLNKCSEPKTFHVVQSLSIRSSPGERLSRRETTRMPPDRKADWHTHYYAVTLRLATLTVLDLKEMKKAATTTTSTHDRNKPIVPILH